MRCMIMHLVMLVCMLYIYMYVVYLYVCQQNVCYLTTRKSPAECILLLSHWVKTPPVWFAKSSKLYRQSNSYLCIRATWAPAGPRILYNGTQSTCMLWCRKLISPFRCSFYCIIVLNSRFSSVHWQCSVHTGYVFCGTLVLLHGFSLVWHFIEIHITFNPSLVPRLSLSRKEEEGGVAKYVGVWGWC